MNLNQEERWLLKEKYQGTESEAFRADLKRLTAGEPLAYVIGHVPFLDCKIYLDSKPLIPRPETEHWVEKVIEEIRKAGAASPRPPRILDLCSGSGCIGVAVLKAVPNVHVTFSEIDPSHIPTILKNIEQNLSIDGKVLPEHYEVVQSDLFENVSGKFDFILTNPPYIDPTLDRTEESVKKHEPRLALYGGKDGLDIINDIVTESQKYLCENGQLWIEHEPEQIEAIKQSAFQNGFSATTHPDQYNVDRYSVLTIPKS